MPQFWWGPAGPPPDVAEIERMAQARNAAFAGPGAAEGLGREAFVLAAAASLELPGAVAHVLFDRLASYPPTADARAEAEAEAEAEAAAAASAAEGTPMPPPPATSVSAAARAALRPTVCDHDGKRRVTRADLDAWIRGPVGPGGEPADAVGVAHRIFAVIWREPKGALPPAPEPEVASTGETSAAATARAARTRRRLLAHASAARIRELALKGLTPCMLVPLLRAVVDTHPGLEFLRASPDFQTRYLETVCHRIYHALDRGDRGCISRSEFVRSPLPAVLAQLDREEDVNRVRRFFSYEHFYVIYCRFWELDGDHDFAVGRDDLLRYGNNALTYRAVDRVLAGRGRPLRGPTGGAWGDGTLAPERPVGDPGAQLGYEDFCWFILSEEDKTTDAALRYWHGVCDEDEDGYVGRREAAVFYEEQLQRMESLLAEPVGWDDLWCQLIDLLGPQHPDRGFSLADLKRSGTSGADSRNPRLGGPARHQSGTLFHALCNINKFVAFETRDPFGGGGRPGDSDEIGPLTPWDRFASAEYVRLALEEDGERDEGGMELDGDGGF